MSLLRIVPIVEGHGEDEAVPVLLRRISTEMPSCGPFQVLKPIRGHRASLVKEEELCRAIGLAALKLKYSVQPGDRSMILVILDADQDLPCVLAPTLARFAHNCRADLDVCCIVANIEYESWFVASAETLGDYLRLPEAIPLAPESLRLGKGWIQRHFNGPKYSETVDQPRLTSKIDLQLCKSRSPSFDKLIRELERRATPAGSAG